MLTDIERALRRHARAPASALTVILTLALGIGLASATGVIARAIAFAGLPVRDANRLVVLWGVDRAGSFTHMPLGPADMPALADAMRGIATVAAGDYNGAYPWPFHPIEPNGPPLRLRGTLAGGNYFDVLGARPALGRTIHPDDDRIGAPRVMVLSDAAWRRNFSSDPAVLGRALRSVIWGQSYTIVGVMPPGLDLPRGVDFWTAFAPTAARNGSLDSSFFNVDVVARLAPDATPEQARLALTEFYATLARHGRVHWTGARATVRTVPDLVVGDVRPAFIALGAAAVVVLLVTCGNVAGLLLVRAASRRRELAVRAALGASRARLVGGLVIDHGLLAGVGSALGAVLAAVIVRVFGGIAPADLPRIADLGVDWRLFAVVAGVTSLVVVVVGAGPAWLATRVPPAAALGGARDGVSGRLLDAWTRRVLVAGQVALAFTVVSAASLVGRSLAHLTSLDLGVVAPDRIAFVELVPSATAVTDSSETEQASPARWFDQRDAIMDQVRATPGVIAVAPVVHEAYAGAAGWDVRIEAEGAAPGDSARRPYVNMEITNADYLRVTGTRLIRGRWLATSDRADAPPVAVLSERAARLLFPDQNPIGRRVKLWRDSLVTVVGVVADTRFREFVEPRATLYVPYRQVDGGASYLAVRTQGRPAGVVGVIRRAVAEIAPEMLVQDHGTMQSRLAEPLARPRLLAGVMSAYAIVVLTMAVAGLYAVIATTLGERRRELGVRSALGASPGALATLLLYDGARVTIAGLILGLFAALATSRFLASLLYGVGPTDAATLGAASAMLLAVCMIAILLPAWRASRIDPARELRTE